MLRPFHQRSLPNLTRWLVVVILPQAIFQSYVLGQADYNLSPVCFHASNNLFIRSNTQSWNTSPVPPSSSKFNPKDSKQTSKRCQLLIIFPCVFTFLSCFFLVSELRNLKKQEKVIESWCLFGLNFEDEGN